MRHYINADVKVNSTEGKQDSTLLGNGKLLKTIY